MMKLLSNYHQSQCWYKWASLHSEGQTAVASNDKSSRLLQTVTGSMPFCRHQIQVQAELALIFAWWKFPVGICESVSGLQMLHFVFVKEDNNLQLCFDV